MILHEDKILGLIKNKIKLSKKTVNLKEAEEIIKVFNKKSQELTKSDNPKKQLKKSKIKKKK